MSLKIEGLIGETKIEEILDRGQTKAYPLGSEANITVAVFGIEEETGEHLWNVANPEDSIVHVGGGPTHRREGIVKNESVRIGSWTHRKNYVKVVKE